MCDLMHFVVSTPTKNTTAENVVELFMEEVLLNFGMCAVIVIDDGSTLKCNSQKIHEALKITDWWISRENHKGNLVKKFYQFLNKTQKITGGDWRTHSGFIQNANTSHYSWNSAPIDDTDVMRRVSAVGREFRFTLDTEMLPKPTLNPNNNQSYKNSATV